MGTASDRDTMVWPILSYEDARGAIAFLVEAFGFEEGAVYASEEDLEIVEHAEIRWPSGGGVMLGTGGASGRTGASSVHLPHRGAASSAQRADPG